MGEVVRGTMDSEGDAEWEHEPMKPTWEQIVAMQKESAALRAQAAAVLPALPAGVAHRQRRAPSRNEYPVFLPSYRDPPLLSGGHQRLISESIQSQNLGNPAGEDSFRGRLLERRQTIGNDFRPEIVPADSGNSANPPQQFSAVSRYVHSQRSHTLSMGLSPEISQPNGHTPKSTVSGKSDATKAPITPSLSRNVFLLEDAVRKPPLNPGESSRGPVVRQVRDIGNRRRGSHTDAASPTDASLWKGCSGSLSMVAPYAEGTSAAGSGMDASPQPQVFRRPEAQQSTDKPRLQQQPGLFGFLPWGKKAPNVGQAASDRKQPDGEKDSNKDLEKLIKTLQSQLLQAEKQRVSEVQELQSMLKDMQEKFEQLHAHCRNLERQMSKQAKLHATLNALEYHVDEDDSSSLESGSLRAVWERSVPHPSLTPELFALTYDSALVGLRRLSRAICVHIREMGESASQVITAVLENHAISRGRLRKAQKILYFEAFLNQIMFENFENANFEPSGGALVLDPEVLQQLSFQSFQELKGISWPDIEQTLKDEQGVIVNRIFHQFFLVRMDIVLHQLGIVGETNMPPAVISAFFDAIKGVWLLHHLAFSFRPAATILRVSQGAKFEAKYMEQVHESDRESRAKYVFLMINPGFLIDDWVVKCRVYCSRK